MKKSSLIEENYPHLTSSKSEEISVWRVYGVYIVSSISMLLEQTHSHVLQHYTSILKNLSK